MEGAEEGEMKINVEKHQQLESVEALKSGDEEVIPLPVPMASSWAPWG